MYVTSKRSFWDRLLWPWRPASNREAGNAVVANSLLHCCPSRVTLKSLAFGYSLYLGTIAATLFAILAITGLVLMFLYTPSVERAYWSIKDLDHAVSFGWLLRRMHRISAHGMVAVVFLHMFRVFLTGSYKKGMAVGSNRPLNWVGGVVLLVLTLLLSFTGYLLPWDQLAYWAITVGTNIAASVPVMGETLREFMLGGTQIGQSTLIRFYVLHVALLPLVVSVLIAWHMWRVRKDGGLAVVEQLREENKKVEPATPKKSKTYSVLGITRGTSVHVLDPSVINDDNSVPSSPFLTVRVLLVVAATFLVTMLLAFVVEAPLEEAANPHLTPNPAKAPWYFLGLQELVGYSAVFGGVLLPGIVVGGLCLIPYLDREQNRIGSWFTDSSGRLWGGIGFVWGLVAVIVCVFIGVQFPFRELFATIESQLFFDLINPGSLLLLAFVGLYLVSWKLSGSTRTASIATFCAFIIAFLVLTYTGTVLRGPNWEFFFPWEAWPEHPVRI